MSKISLYYHRNLPGSSFSYKLRYIVGFCLVEIAISANQKPTIYRNLYEKTDPAIVFKMNKMKLFLLENLMNCIRE